MKKIMLPALAAALLAPIAAQAGPAPRPLDVIRADLAVIDPYAPGFDVKIDRLLAEEAVALTIQVAGAS